MTSSLYLAIKNLWFSEWKLEEEGSGVENLNVTNHELGAHALSEQRATEQSSSQRLLTQLYDVGEVTVYGHSVWDCF